MGEDGDPTFATSKCLLERARKVEALIDARPTLFHSGAERIGGYPLFVESASGPYIWDVDGNRFIDFHLGYGSVVLGHSFPSVTKAVCAQAARRGGNPTLLSLDHVELAEKIVSLNRVEAVTFLKTGSDATGAAVRLARAITRRKYVIRWGMNGWHDWCAPVRTGVVAAANDHTLLLRYNDLDQAKRLFESHGSDVACLILMPFDVEAPEPGYLDGLRHLCTRYRALFILDEVRSGFRMSIGGAQSYFGVSADLVTYGKAIANGYAISALAGRKDLMRHILSVGMTITYFRAPDAMAAANATIDELVANDGPGRIAQLGRMLMDGLDRAAGEAGIPARSVGLPWTPFLEFQYGSQHRSECALRFFCNGMLRRGILLSSTHHWFLCTTMGERDIETAVDAARDVMLEMASAF